MEEKAHEGGVHIAIAAEKITELFGVPITNTLITSWVVVVFIAILAFVGRKKIVIIPGRIQVAFETLLTFIFDYMSETLGNEKRARFFFPLIATIFIFVLTANLFEFLPGVGSIGFYEGDEFLPLFRSVHTDFNMTLALAFISFFVIEIAGLAIVGVKKYAGKFFNFKSIMGFAIGIIELFSELARIISFSFRLFGNIFAGEVLILVMASFLPMFLPVPIMAFEVFVSFIQASIFSLLTLFFIKLAITDMH